MSNVGWGTFFGGIGKLLSMLPGRKERWKNDLDRLNNEKQELLAGKADKNKSDRLVVIMNKIALLEQLIKNSSDAN